MTLAANLTLLFSPAATWEKIDAAADAGFAGVEILQPYNEDADDLRHTLEAAGPTLVLINTYEPEWDAGGRGYAAIPEAGAKFRESLKRSLAFAYAAACPRVHILAGCAEGEEARATYLENLAFAADVAPDISFTIEPLNPVDQPGYFLNGFDQAASILKALGRTNVGLQFDTYHADKITGNSADAWSSYRSLVTHVQVAGPGRHAPGADEIDLIRQMRTDGYSGWISAEYLPDGPTEDCLGWMTDLI